MTTIRIGDLTVNRLGFGAMRVCGPQVWGPPRDRANALAVLRKAYELGHNFFDTADSYGPAVSEELTSLAMPHATVTIAVTQQETPAPETPAGPQLLVDGRWVRGSAHGVDNPREHQEVDAAGARPQQRPRAGVGGGAGGQHVIDQNEAATGDLSWYLHGVFG